MHEIGQFCKRIYALICDRKFLFFNFVKYCIMSVDKLYEKN